jgi:membrane protease subunit (stomatin/prohibitin family)
MNVEQIVLSTASDNFGQYGVEINKISGLTISLPEEVQKAIDTRSEMGVLGVNYMQYQAGQAVVDAAKNPSGGNVAGLGVGLGAGVGLGGAVGSQFAQGMYQQPTKACPKCGSIIPASNAFCPNCGANLTAAQPAPQVQSANVCAKCGATLSANAKFCANCGAPVVAAQQERVCPKCGTSVKATSKFCPNCGAQL